jgi:hypothetical protein
MTQMGSSHYLHLQLPAADCAADCCCCCCCCCCCLLPPITAVDCCQEPLRCDSQPQPVATTAADCCRLLQKSINRSSLVCVCCLVLPSVRPRLTPGRHALTAVDRPALTAVDQALAKAGVASRRASEALIQEGQVKVNGRRVEEVATMIDPFKDKVRGAWSLPACLTVSTGCPHDEAMHGWN